MSRSLLSVLFLALLSGSASAQSNCTNCFALNLSATPVPVLGVNFTDDSQLATTGTGEWSVSIGAGSPAAIPPKTYTAWCFSTVPPQSPDFQDTYSATSIMVNPGYPLANEVNYILNHKQGVSGYPPPTAADVQVAIWILLDGASVLQNTYGIVPSTSAAALAAAAASPAGQSYVPPPGALMGVVITPPVSNNQPLLIEITNPCAALGDFVWNDANQNGIQDSWEPGINGVTVQLKNSAGNVIGTTITGPVPAGYSPAPQDRNGWYQFTGLSASCSYSVVIPPASAQTPQPTLSGMAPDTAICTGTPAGCVSTPSPLINFTPTNLVNENLDFAYYSATLGLTCPASTAYVNSSYSSPAMASGGTGSFTYQLEAGAGGALPPGLNLNSGTGVVQGRPSTAGQYTFTVLAADTRQSAAGVAARSCTIRVVQSPPPSANCACVTAVQGAPIPPTTLTAAGGAGGPYRFKLTSGPAWLAISDGGTLSGTPAASGTFSYAVTVTDSANNAGTATCSITVLTPSAIAAGDTATIGFWNNKNGQALIDSVNGGPGATALGNWLASTFPYLYGPRGANLGGKPNAQIAAYFQAVFQVKGQKTSAQILAAALACYVTNTSLAGGNYGGIFGFRISTTGTGLKTYSIGVNGASVGLQNNTSYTVLQLLQQVNLSMQNGKYSTYANGFNLVFSDINQSGDIA
jgi:hypothetical protein